MHNSSFLFNYDSEDSSAHYPSTYQSNDQDQPKETNIDPNTAANVVTDSEPTINHNERRSVELGGSTESSLPENERDGSANAETGTPQLHTRNTNNSSNAVENDIEEQINLDEETSETLKALIDPAVPIEDERNQNHVDAQTIWQNTLAELMLQMPSATYDTWMRDTSVIAYEDGEFIIGLPNAYARDWIMNRLQTKIKRILGKQLGRSVQVTFRVVPVTVVERQDASPTPLYDGLQNDTPQHDAIQHDTPQYDAGSQPTANHYSEPVDSLGSDNGRPSSSEAPASREPYQNNGYANHNSSNANFATPQASNANSSLQAGYTFDTFIVGSHNQLAHAAAASIADGPGNSFNPLFIYGGVGLGKTHLLHAVGNLAIARGSRVLYCTSEQFTNELISSIRGRGTEEFRSKYRQVDVLLIDDIQFIAGKESTQEEFFHTFNHLHTAGRQVVLSSDRPPKALATLEERLRSRFEGGLLTDISQPDFETRVAILQSKANKSGIRINADVLMLIAERVDSNIRELEGALNRMVVQAKLFSSTLDLQLAESILRNLAPQRTPRSPSIVIDIVAEHFHLTAGDMCGRSRTKEVAHARQIIMYLLREENAMSLPSIGDQLGGRDHSTVRHGVEKITKDLEHDEQLRREIMALRDKIYAAPESD